MKEINNITEASYISTAHFGGIPAKEYTMLLLNMRVTAGLGSEARSLWGAVSLGMRNGNPDWSKS